MRWDLKLIENEMKTIFKLSFKVKLTSLNTFNSFVLHNNVGGSKVK
jgi:hypothetical protein